MRLQGKVTFVTGAARGIGESIAAKCAEEGARVYVADIDGAGAAATAEEIESRGGSARGVSLDVTDYQAVRAALKEVIADEGRLDVLVNNAGWDQLESFVQSEPETWAKVIAINYLGVVNTCHTAAIQMIEQKGGRIVNIGSDAGRVGSKGEAVYSGAKGGVIAFSKTLARELASAGIGVNVVCPGPTQTPLVMEGMANNERLIRALEKAVPMGRMGQPAEIANAVAFLASDEALFITGQTLSVSGGLTMA